MSNVTEPTSPLRIAVVGLWHLGCVTVACSARHFQVTGLDFEPAIVAGLSAGRAPISEPGLNELITDGLRSGRLAFTSDSIAACTGAQLLWVTYDTPVDENDVSDVAHVLEQLSRCLPHLAPGTLVLISSQLPVGTAAQLERSWSALRFAVSPENLRLGRAIDAFEKAERVVIGTRSPEDRPLLERLFAPFCSNLLWMRTESAEMVKHALNSFLALSITFINEIARICEHAGADAREVATGLKSDVRIGPRAYLGPGGPFAGGTLARDVVTLSRLGREYDEALALIPAIKASNDAHRHWAGDQLEKRLGGVRGKTVTALGLVYTPNTNTLRRSAAVELCQQLLTAGARVRAFDPAIATLVPELNGIELVGSLEEALRDADATVLCTEWPEFRAADWGQLLRHLRRPLLIDANAFLEKQLPAGTQVEYVVVGRP